MANRLIDNKQYGLVGDVLKESLHVDSKLTVAAAYFTLFAFWELKKELSDIEEFRFLFTQPTFVDAKKGQDKIKENGRNLFGVEEELKYKMDLNQAYIARELFKWLKKKASIKSFKNQKMNDSIYFIEAPANEDICLKGPSNLDMAGLGYTNSQLVMLNQLIIDSQFNQQMKIQIERLWNNEEAVEDVKEAVLKKLELLYKDNSPEFIYFVTIYNVFKDFLDEAGEEGMLQSKTGFQSTLVWNKLYNFQKDGVVGAINKIEKYGGCIIADSVGLGKTFEALAVIKYYELKNNKVLVLAPKKLRENWSIYRQQSDIRNPLANDRFGYDILNHTDLTRNGGMSGDIDLDYVNWGNYDLLVIDESHNFRNKNVKEDRDTRYSKLMEAVIKSGVKTKVLLLSATPVNNQLDDLRTQIEFITEDRDDGLKDTTGIDSIKKVTARAQRAFNNWGDLEESERTTARLLEMLDFDYFKLLDSLTIARSRKHIEKYYNMSDIGKFPKREKPITIKPTIDLQNQFPPMEEIYREILRLNMTVYKPMSYVLPHRRDYYENLYDTVVKGGKSRFRQVDREHSLIYLVMSGLLKRLESSIHSFTLTLSKIETKILNDLLKIKQNQAPIFEDGSDLLEDLEEDVTIGEKIKIDLRDIDLIRWEQDLKRDLEGIQMILTIAREIDETRDAKLKDLKQLIAQKVTYPINLGNKKIIIFTSYADTAKYLYRHLSPWIKSQFGLHSAMVTGSGNPSSTMKIKKIDLNSVMLNFSPKSKERDKLQHGTQEEIDILIATDCISEGQNLQDCDYLINFDIHWNPVRIIQRFGRIDRLGSTNEKIQLVNFWPSVELDEYINLENRVKNRMKMLDMSSTGEEDVLSGGEMKDLEFRRKQLEQLQKEVTDMEDINGNITLTDFTLDDFRMDVVNLSKKYEHLMEETPTGIYGIVQNRLESLKEEIRSGVIFCLKRLDVYDDGEEDNSIYPYYLVYVTVSGEVHYNFTHVKKTLDIYRSLCNGNTDLQRELIEVFNQETKSSKRMEKYSELLKVATDDILGKATEITQNSLFTLTDFSFFDTLTNQTHAEFEILTFLVVR